MFETSGLFLVSSFLNSSDSSDDRADGQEQHRNPDQGAGSGSYRQHIRAPFLCIDHDQGILQGENRHESVDEADGPQQPDQAVGGKLSFPEMDGGHDDFIRRISRHCDGRNQRHADRLLLPDHHGDGNDQADVQNQQQKGKDERGPVVGRLPRAAQGGFLCCEDAQPPQQDENEIVNADRAVPQGGVPDSEKAVVKGEKHRHRQRACRGDIGFEVIFGLPSGPKLLCPFHRLSCLQIPVCREMKE